MKDPLEHAPPKSTKQGSPELKETEATSLGPSWVFARFSVYMLQLD